MPKSVKALRRSINVAFIAALIEAIEWPDTNLCRELFQGFRTAGDLRDQDSGVFRPSDDISELVGAQWQRIPLSEVPSGVGASHAALAQSLAEGTLSVSHVKLRDWGLASVAGALQLPAFVVVDSQAFAG